MKIASIILGTLGVGFILWGILGVIASRFPSEDGTPVAFFGWWGLLEIGFGIVLVGVAWLLRRKRRLQETSL